MNETLQRVKLELIDPSPTNPRKTFDTPDWADFVENLRTHGVVQAGVARPSKTKPGRVELVCGGRRFRGSQEAKLPDMPLIIRELTDEQVIEIQQIENLQREDLNVLEEAQGYEDWAKVLMGANKDLNKEGAVEHICGKIGKKRSHVWGRLALLKVVAPVKAALESGKLDPSKAMLIAQCPASLQPVIAKEAVEGQYGHGHPMSFRGLKEHIEENYRRVLKGAPFDLKQTYELDLKEHGQGVNRGPCAGCPMRTGNFPDAETDEYVCTNPKCYEAKAKWAGQAKLLLAKAEKKRTVDPKEYQREEYAYEKTDNTNHYDRNNRKWGALAKLAGISPALTLTKKNELIEVFTKSDQSEIKKFHKISDSGGGGGMTAADKARQKLEKELKEVASRARGLIVAQLVTERGINPKLWKLLAQAADGRTDIGRQTFVAKSRGLARTQNETRDGLDKWLGDKTRPLIDYQRYLVDILLCADWETGHYGTPKFSEEFEALAEMAGVDLVAVKASIDRDLGRPPTNPVPATTGKTTMAQRALAEVEAKNKKPKQTTLFPKGKKK